jgi:hypothetical protein
MLLISALTGDVIETRPVGAPVGALEGLPTFWRVVCPDANAGQILPALQTLDSVRFIRPDYDGPSDAEYDPELHPAGSAMWNPEQFRRKRLDIARLPAQISATLQATGVATVRWGMLSRAMVEV